MEEWEVGDSPFFGRLDFDKNSRDKIQEFNCGIVKNILTDPAW